MLKKPYGTRPTQACRDTHFPSCVLASPEASTYSGEYAAALAGKERVPARVGWVGENESLLNILHSTAVRKGCW
jgi:hypothetical protein